MKKISRKVVLILLTSFLGMCATAVYADRILYTYDPSGNRTQAHKEITLRGQGDSDDSDLELRRESLSLHRITIYPNPTQGRFSVEITGDGYLEGASITIYGMRGNVVYSNAEPEVENNIDLSECSNGVYLLIIKVDGEVSTWKIIKN